MTMELRELYQELIIDHNRNPRNHYAMPQASTQAEGFNPLCGDKLTLYIKLEKDNIKEVSFVGSGCAISQASASLMTEALVNKNINEAHKLFECFHTMLTSDKLSIPPSLDKLTALAGVKAYPARVKCATLAWHTLEAALNRTKSVVSTE